MINNIAIIGAGPSGCALACFLQQRKLNVTVFDDNKKPPVLVGESLIPAAIPLIRKLGIEEQTAEIAHLKRGAAFRHNNGERVNFEFQNFGSSYPDYAFNVPRPQFDALIKNRAMELGVKVINKRAKLDVDPESKTKQIKLSQESLLEAGYDLNRQPDLVIDATGRTRLISRLLKIPATRGKRNDIAYFAHFENFASDSILEGQVVMSVLNAGWSWQIPLPGKTSVGVVIDKAQAKEFGDNADQRLNKLISENELLSQAGQNRVQLTPAMSFKNYQLISDRAAGPGWLLLGDALGFVDPMLSPGVFMALESADLADKIIFKQQTHRSFDYKLAAEKYYSQITDWHTAWTSLINYFYDGRLLSLGAQRNNILSSKGFKISKIGERIVSRSLAQMVGGIGTKSSFNQAVLHHSCQRFVDNKKEFQIHDRAKSSF